jgi:hypothetical protein
MGSNLTTITSPKEVFDTKHVCLVYSFIGIIWLKGSLIDAHRGGGGG